MDMIKIWNILFCDQLIWTGIFIHSSLIFCKICWLLHFVRKSEETYTKHVIFACQLRVMIHGVSIFTPNRIEKRCGSSPLANEDVNMYVPGSCCIVYWSKINSCQVSFLVSALHCYVHHFSYIHFMCW